MATNGSGVHTVRGDTIDLLVLQQQLMFDQQLAQAALAWHHAEEDLFRLDVAPREVMLAGDNDDPVPALSPPVGTADMLQLQAVFPPSAVDGTATGATLARTLTLMEAYLGDLPRLRRCAAEARAIAARPWQASGAGVCNFAAGGGSRVAALIRTRRLFLLDAFVILRRRNVGLLRGLRQLLADARVCQRLTSGTDAGLGVVAAAGGSLAARMCVCVCYPGVRISCVTGPWML